MERRHFTVIPGGAGVGGVADTTTWRIDLVRPGHLSPEAMAAWRALLTRIGRSDAVFSDPDYLQAAAQHRAGGCDVVFALAWTGADTARTLRAAVALTVPHPIWGRGRFLPWQAPNLTVTPAVEARFAPDLTDVLTDRLKALRWNAALDLGPIPLQNPASRPALGALSGLGRIPDRALIDVGGPSPSVRQHIAEPNGIRDAVEEFLVLDAAHAAAPIIANPSEANFVRVVMQLFARRRLAAVDLNRRDGRVIAAALRLGAGPHAVVWRRARIGLDATRRRDRSA